MTQATEKQVNALKSFAKNPKLSQGILKGVEFDGLSKEEATELIKNCIAERNGEGPAEEETEAFVISYSQNYKNGNGAFATVMLEGEELEEVRSAHREHCVEVMAECAADYPDDKEAQLAMFNHRCDKIFSWIQQALDEKVRNKRQ
ncbi:hypothetical protein FJZ53_07095 [Candidatus Woesearchaeota archaeon]|nr:hypothetical protein [Candidatus Woesearchaeota archaeon]